MSTSLNGFSVIILGTDVEHFRNGEHNYYSLSHLSEYYIKLVNNRPTKCHAKVFIEGNSVGTWRIKAFSNITLERQVNINKKFVFIEKSNADERAKYNNGLINVIFKPENIKLKHRNLYILDNMYHSQFAKADQFDTHTEPPSIDIDNITIINLRLVLKR